MIWFNYIFVDGEEGFFGNLEVEMIYCFEEEENVIVIEYCVIIDKVIVVNLINYGFFNLVGIVNFILIVENNIVIINVDFYILIDEVFILIGEIVKVEGILMDFCILYIVGEWINDKF